MPSPTLEAPTEALRRLVDDTLRAWDPVWQSWAAAVPSWPAATPARRPDHECGHPGCSEHHHRSTDQYGCRERHCESGHEHHGHAEHPHGCHCDRCACCVRDADLVVVTRLGESRIVPLVIHNDIRRERSVTVKVGDFSGGCHRDAEIRVLAAARPAGAITLAPCSRTEVAILLRSGPAPTSEAEIEKGTVVEKGTAAEQIAAGKPAKATARTRTATIVAETPKAAPEAERLERGEAKDLPDVDSCTTLYADVSVEGCGRPVRLAVVVLPRGCDAYDVRCSCGCCC